MDSLEKTIVAAEGGAMTGLYVLRTIYQTSPEQYPVLTPFVANAVPHSTATVLGFEIAYALTPKLQEKYRLAIAIASGLFANIGIETMQFVQRGYFAPDAGSDIMTGISYGMPIALAIYFTINQLRRTPEPVQINSASE